MSKIEQNVMGTVAAIYAWRLLISFTAVKLYTLIFSLIGIALLVSVPNVFENFSHVAQGGVASIWVFILSAIVGTTLLVQFALLLGTLSFISLFADAIRRRTPHRLLA
jgi:hypothetical protein